MINVSSDEKSKEQIHATENVPLEECTTDLL